MPENEQVAEGSELAPEAKEFVNKVTAFQQSLIKEYPFLKDVCVVVNVGHEKGFPRCMLETNVDHNTPFDQAMQMHDLLVGCGGMLLKQMVGTMLQRIHTLQKPAE